MLKKNFLIKANLALLTAFFHLISIPGIAIANPSTNETKNRFIKVSEIVNPALIVPFATAPADSPQRNDSFLLETDMTLEDLMLIQQGAVTLTESDLSDEEKGFIKGFVDGIKERYPVGEDNVQVLVNLGKDAVIVALGFGVNILLTGVLSTLTAMGAVAVGQVVVVLFVAGVSIGLLIHLGSIIRMALNGESYAAGKDMFNFSRELLLFVAGAKLGNSTVGYITGKSSHIAKYLVSEHPAFANKLNETVNPVCQRAVDWTKEIPLRVNLWKKGQTSDALSLFVEKEGYTTLSKVDNTYIKGRGEACRMELTENPEYSRLNFVSEHQYTRPASEAENFLRTNGYREVEPGQYIRDTRRYEDIYTHEETTPIPEIRELGTEKLQRIEVTFEESHNGRVSVGALRRGNLEMSPNGGAYDGPWVETCIVDQTSDPFFVNMKFKRSRVMIRGADDAARFLYDEGYRLVETDMYLVNDEGREILWKVKGSDGEVSEQYIRIAGSRDAFNAGLGEATMAEIRLLPDGTIDKVPLAQIYPDEIMIPGNLVNEAKMQNAWNEINPASAPEVLEVTSNHLRMAYFKGRTLLSYGEGELKLNPGAWERFVAKILRYHRDGKVYNDLLEYCDYEGGVVEVIPKNNLMVKDGEIYLLDFGIATEVRAGDLDAFGTDLDHLWYLERYLIDILKVKNVKPIQGMKTPEEVLEVQHELAMSN